MLKVKNVSKLYKNSEKHALKDLSLEIKEGEFVALLGHNGAGKSTLINIIGGNVLKTSGKIELSSFDLDKNELETKRIVGIVPQESTVDSFFTVYEILRNQSGYFGIKDNDLYIDSLLESLSLSDKKDSLARSLSGGMKRRLTIAKALIHKPKLLILDEPTAGVDIELRRLMYDFLNELHRKGTTIILTTHYLEEAEKLCDRIIVINEGKLLADESKDVLMEKGGTEIGLEFFFDNKIEISEFEFLSEYKAVVSANNSLLLRTQKSEVGEIFNKLRDRNKEFSNFKLQEAKLEDIFLSITQNRGDN